MQDVLVEAKWLNVSIPFRADTGFELFDHRACSSFITLVSIPFRADTGFEPRARVPRIRTQIEFQSLSGLTLGLNWSANHFRQWEILGFNPFQG